jgi:putative phosphoesterase
VAWRLAVLADTHLLTAPRPRGRWPDSIWPHLRAADAILHAGDLLDAGVLDVLAEYAPVHAVLGNNDRSLVGLLPTTTVLKFGGVQIGMVHDSGSTSGRSRRMRRLFPAADVVVFGHSHAPVSEIGEGGQVLFNPGSPTQRRAQPVHTMGELLISGEALCGRRIINLD